MVIHLILSVQITEAAVLEGGSVSHQLSVIDTLPIIDGIFKQTHSFAQNLP